MAREFAQIKLAIWADDDWRDLSPLARYLYLTLLTSPTLSHCGVADWRPSRLSALNGMAAGDIETCGSELIETLYLVIDEDSEEALIRSFVRNDGLMKQPKMAVAMASAHAAVASQGIRGVIVHELKRLKDDFPDLNGWGSERATELLALRSINPSTYPCGKGKATPIGKGSTKGSPTPTPTPATTNSTFQTSAIAIADMPRDDVEAICEHLADRIEANGVKRPTITKAWRDAARLMLDRDERTVGDVLAAINWSQADEFWRANILSMPKLRQKYDQLRLQANRTQKPKSQQTTDDLFARAMQRGESQ